MSCFKLKYESFNPKVNPNKITVHEWKRLKQFYVSAFIIFKVKTLKSFAL